MARTRNGRTGAIQEAAQMTARALEALEEENDILRADLAAANIRAEANEAQCAYLEGHIMDLEKERDRYKMFATELATQLRNVRNMMDDAFNRAAQIAELTTLEAERRPLLPHEEPPLGEPPLEPEDAPDFLKRQDKREP